MRSIHVAKRVLRQVAGDRRTMALLFLAPLFILFLLYSVLGTNLGTPNLETVQLPSEMVTAFEKEAAVTEKSDLTEAMQDLKNRQTDGVLEFSDDTVTVHVEGSETSVTAAVKKAVASAMSSYAKTHAQQEEEKQMALIQQKLQSVLQQTAGAGVSPSSLGLDELSPTIPVTEVNFSFLNGSEDTDTFQSIAPLLLGFFVFFFVFIIAGVAFLRERTSGTLERMLATPVRRFEIVFGYFLGFGVFALIQTVLIQFFLTTFLGVAFKGNFFTVLLINILLAACALSLGTLLSAYARNELQMFQFIPIVIVPQILFCGLFSLRSAPAWIAALAKVFPLTYGSDAIINVAIRGYGLSAIGFDLFMLAAFTALFIGLNTQALKKYRCI